MITIMIMGTGIIMIMGRRTEESEKAGKRKSEKSEITNLKSDWIRKRIGSRNWKLETQNSKLET